MVLDQRSSKQKFIADFAKYVKPLLTFPSHPLPADVYWNPRAGNWYTYATTAYDVADRGWPKVDLSGYFVDAAKTYDTITDQYLHLAVADQPAAFWDPRRTQWMSIKPRGIPRPPIAEALRKLLEEVLNLHREGVLGSAASEQIEAIIRGEIPL